jgi:Glycosyl hydrolase catalytic core
VLWLTMHRGCVALVVAVVCALPAAAAAQVATPHVDVGIAEQSAEVFGDARFRATGIRHARLIVPYDVVQRGGEQLHYADTWLAAAQAHGIEPLVTFTHAMGRRRQFKLPKVAQYSARVREFRERYPWVREYATWNEANLVTQQPTARHPRRAAAFYRALRRQCAETGCRVLAVEVLLTGSWKTWQWVKRFRAAAGPGPHTWGVHNYPDTTRLGTRNTGIFLRRVPRDEIWFTETGGIVRFRKRWPHDERRAARAVRHTFRLAASSPRITRMYLYNWRAVAGNRRWDSGIISADGVERRAYHELLDGLALERFRPPPPPVVADTPPPGRLPADDSDD